MTRHLTEHIIEMVRQAADIVSVISNHLQLKKAGANYKALCPFHQEKTPSFSVNPQRQIFKCFGCGKAGNVFHFLMFMDGLSFPEAVTTLAEQYNIELPKQEETSGSQVSRDIADALAWSAVFFQRQLVGGEGKIAREYLQKRAISQKMQEQFQVGYAPPSWDSLFKEAMREGFTAETLLQAGLSVENKQKQSYYDRFRNRVMFPIWSHQGKVIAFGGRVLSNEDNPKYLNSPETSLFSKKRVLYAFHMARPHISKEKSLYIMEGYTDVIMSHQYDVNRAVATLGTSLTVEHTSFLKRYTDCVTLVYDGDSAGIEASQRSLANFLGQGIIVKIAILPDNLDPCDFLLQRGVEVFNEVIDKAQDFFDFLIQRLNKKYDLQTTGGRRSAITELGQTINQIPDLITRQLFAGRIAEVFRIPVESIAKELGLERKPTMPVSQNNFAECRNRLHQDQERFILSTVLQNPNYGKEIFRQYQPEHFRDPKLAILAKYIYKNLENDISLDVATLSSQLQPELGEELVSLYYSDDLCEEDQEKLQTRLKMVLKGLERKNYKDKLNQWKQVLAEANPQDQELQNRILLNARDMCKARLRELREGEFLNG